MLSFVDIFADPNETPLRGLYAIRYDDMPEDENTWSQFMDAWSDAAYRREFMKERKVKWLTNGYWGNYSVEDASERALDEFLEITDELSDAYTVGIENLIDVLRQRFKNLDNYGGPNELVPTKGKPQQPREPWIRLYAIRVSENLYLFTGGTIKLCKYMDQDEATRRQKAKLNRLRDCLKGLGMYDQEAYTELEL